MSQLPEGAVLVSTIQIQLYMQSDNDDRIGIQVSVEGLSGTAEVVGIIEMAKHQYIKDKAE